MEVFRRVVGISLDLISHVLVDTYRIWYHCEVIQTCREEKYLYTCMSYHNKYTL
jgi:hypothetical protein